MKITYIGHSGFMVELEDKALLFDYYKGTIPAIDENKWLYVFSSHNHGDHFNPEVLEIKDVHEKTKYILSDDIKKINDMDVICVREHQELVLDDIKIQTLKSNDEGVAFLVYIDDKVIYHAGDLNWWHWEGEPDEDNHYMEESYKEEISKLKDISIDVAFIVLDPRQEEQFYWGFDWFMKNTDTKFVVPMHMWDEYSWTEKFLKIPESESYRDKVLGYTRKGEVLFVK